MISENVAIVREKIKKAAERAGKNPGAIRLVCVAKGRPLEEIEEAIGAGIVDIGENKVQEARGKCQVLSPEGIKWHMVGHLQTNKAREAVKIFDLIHSVDSLRLAIEIDKEAASLGKVQDILVEVNASGEKQKFGISQDGLTELVKGIILLKNIRLLGLMTMAPFVKDKETARPYFRTLRQLQGEVNNFLSTNGQPVLSMGMSQDYEVAVEEGATMVRIGSAIFNDK